MNPVFKFFSSLRLTVALLALSTVLVFMATWDQIHWGVYAVQKDYFETFVAMARYPTEWPGGGALEWLRIPLPGGFLLGALLIINLLCAHFRYFRASWKKCGIAILHAGVVLLIVSGFLTAYLQEENFMWIDVGARSNYLESFRDVELAFTNRTDPQQDVVVSIPAALLQRGEVIRNPALPFTVKPEFYYSNSGFIMRSEHPETPKIPADRGAGAGGELGVAPIAYDYTNESSNTASTVVKLEGPSGPIGSWLVSTLFEPRLAPPFLKPKLPQTFTVDGHTWEVALRPRREYLPFSLQLDKFIHESYPGTQVPKRFESQGRLLNPATGEDRPILVYMNHPLRYGGLTFYQASFAPGDSATMLQVVRNPGWPLPYLAVAMVGVGMLVQFLLSLFAHLGREKARSSAAAPTGAVLPQTSAVRTP